MASLVETALAPFPHRRLYYHVAVTWNNATLIIRNPFEVFHHIRGKWTIRATGGDLPKSGWQKDVQVINDKMYMLVPCGDMVLYCLNLHTLIWQKLSPRGKTPLYQVATRSWTYNGNIFYFGGLNPLIGDYNEVFSYNISTNMWWWPDVGGDLPSPRGYAWIIIKDNIQCVPKLLVLVFIWFSQL